MNSFSLQGFKFEKKPLSYVGNVFIAANPYLYILLLKDFECQIFKIFSIQQHRIDQIYFIKPVLLYMQGKNFDTKQTQIVILKNKTYIISDDLYFLLDKRKNMELFL